MYFIPMLQRVSMKFLLSWLLQYYCSTVFDMLCMLVALITWRCMKMNKTWILHWMYQFPLWRKSLKLFSRWLLISNFLLYVVKMNKNSNTKGWGIKKLANIMNALVTPRSLVSEFLHRGQRCQWDRNFSSCFTFLVI